MIRVRAVVAVLVVLPAMMRAQATVTVAVQDPVYRDLDRLLGSGIVRTMIVGQKPYSRREIARIVAAASKAESTTTVSPTVAGILARLRGDYEVEINALTGKAGIARGATLDVVSLEVLGTNSAARAIPFDSTGSVDADLNPLLSGRAGRTYRPGVNSAVEGEMSVRALHQLVFRARERGYVSENGGSSFSGGDLLAASGSLLLRNVITEVGRQQFVWGQGMEGGLLGSTSGRPLDMVRIATDTPFYLPWALKHLGPMRETFIVASLGRNQAFPGSYVIAYKASGNPWSPRFEFSASVFSEQGGTGAPSATYRDRIIDLIPALQYTLPAGDKSHAQISNKFAGWEYRYRAPELGGMQIYIEHQFDDMDPRRWRSTLWEEGGHIAGVSFASLGGDGALSATAEYHHTGIRYYKHAVFSSGVEFNRTLLGDPLGNQGNAGYLRLAWDHGGPSTLSIDGALERRGGNYYAAREDGAPPHETNFHFDLLKPGPAEWRQRAVMNWEYRMARVWRSSIQVGYEAARNYAFVKDASRNNFLASVGLELITR
jgi:hypothetical protein